MSGGGELMGGIESVRRAKKERRKTWARQGRKKKRERRKEGGVREVQKRKRKKRKQRANELAGRLGR